MTVAPLLVTLALDEGSTQHFDDLRRRLFPPQRYQVGAHLTLFHQLPGEELDAVLAAVGQTADRPAFDVAVTRVRSLGKGAAYDLRAAELDAVHTALRERFAPWLTRQDAQRLNAHVTVTNFLDPPRATAVVADLAAGFAPWTARALGLEVHRYLGGPWEPVAEVAFTG